MGTAAMPQRVLAVAAAVGELRRQVEQAGRPGTAERVAYAALWSALDAAHRELLIAAEKSRAVALR